jgi:multicomponent Na+:H+ antiporter subunit G
MQVLEWIRFVAGVGLLLMGLAIFILQIYGVFKFKYVLNRMHAAAMGDTLAIGVSLTGLIILSGFNFTSLKMAMIILFLWLASPVSSHLISRLEVVTNEHLAEHCELPEHLEEDELC